MLIRLRKVMIPTRQHLHFSHSPESVHREEHGRRKLPQGQAVSWYVLVAQEWSCLGLCTMHLLERVYTSTSSWNNPSEDVRTSPRSSETCTFKNCWLKVYLDPW